MAYKETITRKVEVEGKFVRQSGGRGQYGHVVVQVGPNEAGKGFEFENAIVGGAIPKGVYSFSADGYGRGDEQRCSRRLSNEGC